MRKFIAAFLISTLLTSQAYAQEATDNNGSGSTVPVNSSQQVSVTSISPSSFSPGNIVTLDGTGFGDIPPSAAMLCFAQDICVGSQSFSKVVLSWSDTRIRIQIPIGVDIPSKGNISFLVKDVDMNLRWIDSPEYIFQQKDPKIFSVTPSEVIPNKTLVTISGENFGPSLHAKDQICVNNLCISTTAMSQYVKGWSDSQITLLLPSFQGTETAPLSLQVYRYTQQTDGKELFSYATSTPITFLKTPDPIVDSISPENIIPGETIVSIKGTGFGDKYKTGYNQLCISEGCIGDDIMQTLLVSWSDTEIQFRTPAFFTKYDTVRISMRLLFPSQNSYKAITMPNIVKITHLPIIQKYYTVMETGRIYSLTGVYFGETKGSVEIGNITATIIGWSDDLVTFEVPDTAISAGVRIVRADNVKSSPVYSQIQFVKRYSKDEFSDDQWYLETLQANNAWKITEGSPDVVVAVLDSGVDLTHEDLQGSIWTNSYEIPNNGIDDDKNGFIDDVHGWNVVENSNNMIPINNHGTMVASIIAGQKDNRVGIAGIAPRVKIMPITITKKANETIKEDFIQ